MSGMKEEIEYVDYCSSEHVKLMQEGWEFVRYLNHPDKPSDLIIVLKRPKGANDGHKT